MMSNSSNSLEEELTEMLQAITPDTQDPDVLEFYKSQFLELIEEASTLRAIEELEAMLKPQKCYRPWCKQEHTLVKKSYVKDRINQLRL